MNFDELSVRNGFTAEAEYPTLVDKKIRKRYSISAELALNRQKETKPSEWAEYNAYCEACKVEAKRELGL